ncbi:MAG: ATP-binding cassette domain-containing protein, partial [Actinomycetales bacterium]|nr:ATP-binding cassette domain-containing protein [Actinomycetales bacterium]
MIQATDIELRAGSELLLAGATFRIDAGDKVGLVGRNGAGKTTLTRVLAGQGQPASGTVATSGSVGYLPQDPRTGDLDVLARDRILSARGLDVIISRMRQLELEMASENDAVREKAMRKYSAAEAQFQTAGGYAAESEASSMASSLGLSVNILNQTLETLSGGQRRRIELARILFSGADT